MFIHATHTLAPITRGRVMYPAAVSFGVRQNGRVHTAI